MGTFSKDVVVFKCSSVGFVGNVANGAVAAISDCAFEKCAKALARREEWDGFDPSLDSFLQRNAFFENPSSEQCLTAAYVHVTERCNLNCFACYAENTSGCISEDPSLEELRFLFSHLRDLKVKQVYISGGEPFLREDLPAILEYAKTHGDIPCVVLLTNGTLVNEDMAERVSGWVDGVSVSLDATSSESECRIRGENRLDAILRSIQLLKQYDIPVSIDSTIHADNVEDIPEYVRLAEGLGVKLHYSLLTPTPSCPDLEGLSLDDDSLGRIYSLAVDALSSNKCSLGEFGSREHLAVKDSCGAGRKTVSIAADGSVFPCHMLHYDALRMGNAFLECGLKGVLKDAAHELSIPKVDHIPSCAACEVRYFCGGGCRASSMAKLGHLRSKDTLCTLSKLHFNNVVCDVANRCCPSG